MKKHLLATFSFAFLASCSFAPESYDNAMEMIEAGKYENAVEMLKRVTIDDKEWLDSAQLRKVDAFNLLVRNNDWERTLIFAEQEQEDKMYKKEMRQSILDYARELVKTNQIDSLMTIIDQNNKFLGEVFEDEFVAKMADLVAQKVFTGDWIVASTNLKGNQIHFEPEGDLYLGKSKKSASGWTKDKVIYKVGEHKQGATWQCSPRIFQSSNYYYSYTEYFSNKGVVTVYSPDSILIDYKVTSNPRVILVRQK